MWNSKTISITIKKVIRRTSNKTLSFYFSKSKALKVDFLLIKIIKHIKEYMTELIYPRHIEVNCRWKKLSAPPQRITRTIEINIKIFTIAKCLA